MLGTMGARARAQRNGRRLTEAAAALRLAAVVLALSAAACSDEDGADPDASVDSGLDGGDSAHDAEAEASTAADAATARDGATRSDGGNSQIDAGSDGAVEGGTGTVEQACARIEAVTCEYFDQCRTFDSSCADNPNLGPLSNIRRTCAGAVEGVEAGLVEFHPDSLETCLEAAQEAASLCVWPMPTAFWATSAYRRDDCQGIFTGTAGLGEDCYADLAYGTDGCGEGYCLSGDACPGTCTAYTALGESCGTATTRCAPTAYCDDVCTAYASLNGACDDDVRCAPGQVCGTDLRCHRPGSLGEPCLSARSGNGCQPGLTCAPEGEGGALVCIAPAPNGGACKSDGGCASASLFCNDGVCSEARQRGQSCYDHYNCPEADYCARADSSDPLGVCQARLGAGSACTDERECVPAMDCEFGSSRTCVARAALGESCASVHCADGMFCNPTGNTCAALVAENGTCDRTLFEGCAEGLTCQGDGLCHPKATQVGDPCNGNVGESCGYDTGLFCDRTTQRCAAPAAEGERCNSGESGASCQEGLWCACGGVPCAFDGFDPYSTPDDEVCALAIALGQPCESGSLCADNGYCGPDDVCIVSTIQRCDSLP